MEPHEASGIATMDVYKRLQELLDKNPAGCPAAPEIDKILRILFTEEQARVALGLGFRPLPVGVIAKRAGVGPGLARQRLEALADKGLVFAKKKHEQWHYALLPVMPGLFEFPYMKGQPRDVLARLRPLWKVYLSRLSRGLGSPSMSITRVIPIQEKIPDEPGVLTYERVYEMIEKARVVGIARCACREVEQGCEAPREACMLFDDTCTFLVERGMGRILTKEALKRKLREFDQYGLVHQVNNSKDRLTLICNCCPCCCGLLKALTEFKNPHVIASSGFVPQIDPDRCTGCGVCAEQRCPMKAISIVDGRAVVAAEPCIGCGLCASGCPEEVVILVRREKVSEPAPSVRDMGLAILEEKGKLADFLAMGVVDPGEDAYGGEETDPPIL
jgi:NAD-dependent dihydropyrimidine dehydrogenase PreA subunit